MWISLGQWQSLLSPTSQIGPAIKHWSQSTSASKEPWEPGVGRSPHLTEWRLPEKDLRARFLLQSQLKRNFSFGFSKQAHFLAEHFCQLLSVLIFWQPSSVLFCKRVGKLLMILHWQPLCSPGFLLRTWGWQWDTASPCLCPEPHDVEPQSQTHRNYLWRKTWAPLSLGICCSTLVQHDP